MPKITSVEPQTLRLRSGPSRRFNIFLDGEFAFGVDEDLVVNRRLVTGKVLNASDLEQLLFEAEVGKLMERMYRLFNIRARSEKEVRNYLRNLSFKRKLKGEGQLTLNIINATIELMKKKGMIDDEEFAKAWVEARSKKYGLNRIRQELYQKGVSREIIEEAVSRQQASEGEGYSEDVAKQLLEKKMNKFSPSEKKSWKNLQPMEFKKKAYEFLLRRGFKYEEVKDIVENLLEKR